MVVLAGGLAGFGGWAVFGSSWLTVDDVTITGADTVEISAVRDAARVPVGRPLASVDLGAIRARVAAMPPIASVEVTRSWPHQVRVRVTERVPVAVVEIAGRLRALDETGAVFAAYRSAPSGLPLVQANDGYTARALGEAAAVVSSLPEEIAARVDHVEVGTVDEISLVLRDDSEVRWGSSSDSGDKARVLSVLLQQTASSYDVSVPGQPTTRG